MKQAINKWNNRIYTVKHITDGEVALIRDDGSEFVISMSEFKFSYRKVKDDCEED